MSDYKMYESVNNSLINNSQGLNYANVLNAINSSAQRNTAMSQGMAERQMQFNHDEAAIARIWQEEMSNTAHQREVKDLLAAGLNPILSVNNGAHVSSASAAHGASGQVDQSYSQALASYVSSMINSASSIAVANVQAAATYDSSDTALLRSTISTGGAILNKIFDLLGKSKLGKSKLGKS